MLACCTSRAQSQWHGSISNALPPLGHLNSDGLECHACRPVIHSDSYVRLIRHDRHTGGASPPQDDDSGGGLECLSSSPQQELGRMHDPGRIYDGGVLAASSRLPILVQPQIQIVHPDLHIACGAPLVFTMSLAITGMHLPAKPSSA